MIEALGNGERVDFDPVRGWARMRFTARAAFADLDGSVQGGFVCAWIDAAMAHACRLRWDDAFMPATLEMKVANLEPVPITTLYAEGWIVRDVPGDSVVYAEGRLVDADDNELARASSTIKKARARP